MPAGGRNPLTRGVQIEGFDIDLADIEIAKAIFGDPGKVKLVVITAAQRIPVLQDRSVDIVARNMTMNCARWQQIAFSSEYYHSGQKVLVRKGSTAQEPGGPRRGKVKVCAPNGTTSLTKLQESSRQAPSPSARQPHRVPRALPAGPRSTRSPATTPSWPGSPPRTRMPSSPPRPDHRRALRPGVQQGRRRLRPIRQPGAGAMKADGRWKAIYDTVARRTARPGPGSARGGLRTAVTVTA
jgi:polar amino acid transport system substrate-binding protein